MKHYVVHDGVNIIRTGSCDDEILLDQIEFGSSQIVVETDRRYTPENLSMQDGVIVFPGEGDAARVAALNQQKEIKE
jgi:hypothetical protein